MKEKEFAYLLDGQKVFIIKIISEKSILVSDVYNCVGFDEPPYENFDEQKGYIVEKVFDEPPILVFDEKIINKQKELEDLKKQIVDEKNKRETQQKSYNEFVKLYPEFEQVRGFMNGEYEYFVEEHGYYSKILTKQELMDNSDKWDKKIRCIKLTGELNKLVGKMGFEIYDYSDGSGSGKYKLFMFKTKEQAIEKLKELIYSYFDNIDYANIRYEIDTSACEKYGIEIPQKVLDYNKNFNLKKINNRLEVINKEKTELEEKLKKLA